jgi:raffinose/stachyose/melibiose transport system substrate-binding protein
MSKKIFLLLSTLVISFMLISCDSNRGVYYLNFKPEADAAWINLAKKYTEATGVNVTVVTAAEGRYEETLTTEMNKSSAPTLFQISGQVAYNTWKDFCLDLSNTEAYKQLISDDYAIKDESGVYGIAYVYEGYGLITNKKLLETAGFKYEDITSFEKLKEVALSITSRKNQLGFGAFSSSGLDGSSNWRFSGHLTNIPLYYEFTEDKIQNQPATIKGTYIDNMKMLWDLYINNTYNVNPTALTSSTLDSSRAEFLNGKAVFYQNGTWEYSAVSKVLKDEEIGFLPMYMGIDDANQGLSSGTENYWAINKQASQKDQQDTIDFLNWVTTNEVALTSLANDMGYVAPFKKAVKTNNLLYDYIDLSIKAGKTNIGWLFTYTPNTEAWRNGVVDSMAVYSANQNSANWEKVRNAMVNGWEEQYKLSVQQ